METAITASTLSKQRSQAETLLRVTRAIIDPDVDHIIINYLDHALAELIWRDRGQVCIPGRQAAPTPARLLISDQSWSGETVTCALARKIERNTPIGELPWSRRTINVILLCGFRQFGELLKWKRAALQEEVMRCPNSKRSTWNEIEQALDQAESE